MTRIHLSTGAWFDIDRDIDWLGNHINMAVQRGLVMVEFDGWAKSHIHGDVMRYYDEKLVLNINHIVRLDAS